MGFVILALIAFLCFVLVLYTRSRRSYVDVPAIGYGGFLTSYLSAIRFVMDSDAVMREGYARHKNGVFKVPLMDRWLVIVTGELYEKLRTAPEQSLSMWGAMIDLLQVDHTLGPEGREDPYHLPIIRNTLNKNLDSLLPGMLDETLWAFNDKIGSKLHLQGWTPIPALDTFTRIVSQVTSRTFVGLPVCRNEEYSKLNIQFTKNVIAGATVINLFPVFMKPFIGFLYNKISGHQTRMLKLLGPEIEQRKRNFDQLGKDYVGKPNDMLTWVMEAATPGLAQTTSALALRMLNVNFMSLHSTSVSFTHAVYYLASQPKYQEILRSEIELHLVGQEKWTIEDFDRCEKLDSFLKETLRLNGIGTLALPRKALVTYTFPDGTVVPSGMIISAAPTGAQHDEEYYEHAEEFDGLRFWKLRDGDATKGLDSGEDIKNRLTSASPGFLAFGAGKHICPGRFFGSLELKCMVTHILLHFDVKMEYEGIRPKNEWFGPICMPAVHANVLFRHRHGKEI